MPEAIIMIQQTLAVLGYAGYEDMVHGWIPNRILLMEPSDPLFVEFQQRVADLVRWWPEAPVGSGKQPTVESPHAVYLRLSRLNRRMSIRFMDQESEGWAQDPVWLAEGDHLASFARRQPIESTPAPLAVPAPGVLVHEGVAYYRAEFNDIVIGLVMTQLTEQLLAQLKQAGHRYFIQSPKGPHPLSWGDMAAPGGLLPALLAAAATQFPEEAATLWPLRWVSGVAAHHLGTAWGAAPKCGVLPTWDVPESDWRLGVANWESPLGIDRVNQQHERWRELILAVLATARDHPEDPLWGHALTALIEAWKSPFAIQDRVSQTVPLGNQGPESLRDLLHYDAAALHKPCRPAMVVFPVPPLKPPDNENESRSPVIQSAIEMAGQPVPLCGWPLPQVWQSLLEEFPWAQDILDRLRQRAHWAHRMGVEHCWMPPLLLVGPPGCGKTRLAQRLGALLRLPTTTLSAAGNLGSQIIMGTDRHWSNSEPSAVIRSICQHKAANPMIIVDEIDKEAGGNLFGSVQEALLPLLEAETARALTDPCLAVPCDLSQVVWVLTANDLGPLGGPLRSRLEVLTMPHPRPEHLDALVKGVREDLAAQWRLPVGRIPPWSTVDTDWVRSQMGHGALFTAREARRWVERRILGDSTSGLRLVRSS